jgi:hypothetical protein
LKGSNKKYTTRQRFSIKATFEKAGIIFVGSTGVRLKHDQEKGADA